MVWKIACDSLYYIFGWTVVTENVMYYIFGWYYIFGCDNAYITSNNRVWVWVNWCFTSHATIFQSYMWRHRCADGLKKLLYLRSGSQRHRHFAWFFNVPVIHRHGTTLFIRWFRHTAPLVAFYDTLGIRMTYSRLNPPAPWRGAK